MGTGWWDTAVHHVTTWGFCRCRSYALMVRAGCCCQDTPLFLHKVASSTPCTQSAALARCPRIGLCFLASVCFRRNPVFCVVVFLQIACSYPSTATSQAPDVSYERLVGLSMFLRACVLQFLRSSTLPSSRELHLEGAGFARCCHTRAFVKYSASSNRCIVRLTFPAHGIQFFMSAFNVYWYLGALTSHYMYGCLIFRAGARGILGRPDPFHHPQRQGPRPRG